MKTIFTISTIVGSILANTLPRWVHGINGNTFCKFQAISFLLMAVASLSTNRENKTQLILWQYTIGLAFNNAYDELLGDPTKTGIIEITVAILFTLCTLYRLIKCRQEMT